MRESKNRKRKVNTYFLFLLALRLPSIRDKPHPPLVLRETTTKKEERGKRRKERKRKREERRKREREREREKKETKKKETKLLFQECELSKEAARISSSSQCVQ